jgi:hypothetical protein
MSFRRLIVFVEGDDDERFFDAVLRERIAPKYQSVRVWRYARERLKRVEDLLRSAQAMGAEYLYFADIDDAPCVAAKKERIQGKLPRLDAARIAVVVAEIESWYLAGLDQARSKRLGVRPCRNTDAVTKEEFDCMIPSRFRTRTEFMVEVMKLFSTETAKQKNRSLRHFLERHNG